MLRALFALAMLCSAAAAQAEGRGCTSILDRDCGPLPRHIASGDLLVQVPTRERNVTFRDASCKGGLCACREFVQHFDFKGPVPGFRAVNEAEWRAADAARCTAEFSDVVREATHYAVSRKFVSTAIYERRYCQDCGGSCHGRTALATYDATTGAVLRVRDAVPRARWPELKQRLIEDFTAAHFAAPDRAREAARIAASLDARNIGEDGLFVERGKIYINLDLFALSCADGSFYPLEIPNRFLKPQYRRLTEK